MLKAVANVNDIIAPKLVGTDATDYTRIDRLLVEVLDRTKNEWGRYQSKSEANAIFAVSMAICGTGAAASGMPPYQYIARLSRNCWATP